MKIVFDKIDISGHDLFVMFDGHINKMCGFEMVTGFVVMNKNMKVIFEDNYSYAPNAHNNEKLASLLGLVNALEYVVDNGLSDNKVLMVSGSNPIDIHDIWQESDYYVKMYNVASRLLDVYPRINVKEIPNADNLYTIMLADGAAIRKKYLTAVKHETRSQHIDRAAVEYEKLMVKPEL